MAHQNPWTILGLKPGSSSRAVRKAYLRLVREHHPDQFPHGSDLYRWHENRLKEVNQAYRQLLESPPRTAPPPRREPRTASRASTLSLLCTSHRRWAVIYCLVCGAALCSRCDPGLSGYCRIHRPQTGY